VPFSRRAELKLWISTLTTSARFVDTLLLDVIIQERLLNDGNTVKPISLSVLRRLPIQENHLLFKIDQHQR
jgi:hypothetical protein